MSFHISFVFAFLTFFINIASHAEKMNPFDAKNRSAKECPELSGVYICDDEYVFKIKQVMDQGVVLYKINGVFIQADQSILESERVVAGHQYHVQQQANCSQGILLWEELLICQEDVQNICAKGEVAQIKQQRYSLPDHVTLKMNEAWSVGYGPMYKQRFCRQLPENNFYLN